MLGGRQRKWRHADLHVKLAPRRPGQPSAFARMFCGKSRVARYSVEFDREGGVPNPGVDDLAPLLGCFAVSRA